MRRAVSTRAFEKAGTARPGPSAARKRLCQSSFFLGHRLLAEREGEALPDEEELEEFLFAVKGAEGNGDSGGKEVFLARRATPAGEPAGEGRDAGGGVGAVNVRR
jgi:hypothetical protein